MTTLARAGGLGFALLALCCSFAAPRARAWTDARVTGVQAQVDLRDAKSARVELQIQVRVSGGWVSRFELVGLDPDLELLPDAPPVFVTGSGDTLMPQASVDPSGTVALSFASRRGAPARGDHLLRLAYRTAQPLAAAERLPHDRLRVRFELPSWDTHLENVQLELLAPPGASSVPNPEAAYGDRVAVARTASHSSLTFTRAQLPRTERWEVSVDLPAFATGTGLENTSPVRLGARALELHQDLLLGALLGMLALGKRRLTRSACARHRLRALPLVPLPSEALRGALVLGICMAGGALFRSHPVLPSLLGTLGVVLALDRRFQREPVPSPTFPRPTTPGELRVSLFRKLRLSLTPSALLDATTPLGALVALGLYGSVMAMSSLKSSYDAPLWAALLALPLFFTGTRLQRPVSLARMLAELTRVDHELAALPVRPELVVYEHPRAGAIDARLRIVVPSVVAGLGKLELVVCEGMLFGRWRTALALIVTSRKDSPADALLARALPEAHTLPSEHEDSVTRHWVSTDTAADLRALLGWLVPVAPSSSHLARAA